MSAALVVPTLASLSAAKRPNVLFMMADQLRWDVAGYAGNPAAMTPSLDRLASEGLTVKYSWSSTPTCTPARAGILTGKSPWNHGMIGYGSVAPHYPYEMPRAMAEAGYLTASFGKDHFGWNASAGAGVDHGYAVTQLYDGLGSYSSKSSAPHHWDGEFDNYDEWFEQEMPGKDPQATLDDWNGWHGKAFVYPEYFHPTAWVGREAVKYLTTYAAGNSSKPFYAKVSFHRPHSPYDPPARLLNKTFVSDLPPIMTGGNWDDMFMGGKGHPSGCGPLPDAWCGLMPTSDSDLSRRAYYASVAFVDENVGLIYDTLKRTSLLENTFIIWSADHGDGQGDHYHWRKGYPYEFSAHVPMLIRWPASWGYSTVVRGTVIDGLVTELRDVLHTVIDIAGAAKSIPPGTFKPEDGKSMLCLLKDPSGQDCAYHGNPGPWREWIDMEHSTCYNMSNHWNALTDGKIKYIFRAWCGKEQLFNLTADRYEMHDLSTDADYAGELMKWRGRMVKQFEAEQRGDDFVKNGILQVRTKGMTYSPNYPAPPPSPPSPPSKPGTMITMKRNGFPNDCWITPGGGLVRLLPPSTLCLTANGTLLSVELCPGTSAGPARTARTPEAQAFEFTPVPAEYMARIPRPVSEDMSHDLTYNQLVHIASKLCVSVSRDGTFAELSKCSSDFSQQWVDGASGRFVPCPFVPHSRRYIA